MQCRVVGFHVPIDGELQGAGSLALLVVRLHQADQRRMEFQGFPRLLDLSLQPVQSFALFGANRPRFFPFAAGAVLHAAIGCLDRFIPRLGLLRLPGRRLLSHDGGLVLAEGLGALQA